MKSDKIILTLIFLISVTVTVDEGLYATLKRKLNQYRKIMEPTKVADEEPRKNSIPRYGNTHIDFDSDTDVDGGGDSDEYNNNNDIHIGAPAPVEAIRRRWYGHKYGDNEHGYDDYDSELHHIHLLDSVHQHIPAHKHTLKLTRKHSGSYDTGGFSGPNSLLAVRKSAKVSTPQYAKNAHYYYYKSRNINNSNKKYSANNKFHDNYSTSYDEDYSDSCYNHASQSAEKMILQRRCRMT